MITVETIFERFGGAAEVGRILGKSTEHAVQMRRRDSIPPRYWPTLIDAAQKRKIRGITHEALLKARIEAEERAARKRAGRRARSMACEVA
jgi:hypothetical protein